MTRTRSSARIEHQSVVALALALSACGGSTSQDERPPATSDTGGDVTVAEADVDAAAPPDCRQRGGPACPSGTVCSVGESTAGMCVGPDAACAISGPTVACGSLTCGPGSLCDGAGGCYAALPCRSFECRDSVCWGTSCACDRPAPACTPAPLGKPGDAKTLNDFAFTRCGPHAPCDGGIQSLDFDQACNAWAVTTISGPDYLRRIEPTGTVTEFTGLTDLDMGEVSAIRGRNGEFGTSLKAVALTYTCVCGCTPSSTNQQGVAQLDFATSKLPFRIPSKTLTKGAGPFGIPCVDGGPFGLSWGLDEVLYVGNVDANGDYFAADLAKGTTALVHTYPSRVHASAPFDRHRMIVAVEGGEIWLQPIASGKGAPTKLLTVSVTVPRHVTSILRDPWSGRVYAELSDKDIVSFAADGSDLKTFASAPAQGRIAIAPDGFLYHVTLGWPRTTAEIVRFALPTKL